MAYFTGLSTRSGPIKLGPARPGPARPDLKPNVSVPTRTGLAGSAARPRPPDPCSPGNGIGIGGRLSFSGRKRSNFCS